MDVVFVFVVDLLLAYCSFLPVREGSRRGLLTWVGVGVQKYIFDEAFTPFLNSVQNSIIFHDLFDFKSVRYLIIHNGVLFFSGTCSD